MSLKEQRKPSEDLGPVVNCSKPDLAYPQYG